ncbi:PAP/OAS1 substrate-binding domain-containing protein [Clathrospora elynae]|uniref:polynucleotide adenylyltransferase n=1 Tax=Clathrospora elynae TaxID=706981 RepID=A0A6A5T7Y2_9PLEO|nr:PAP/OAS1 substrate-binding domain-containing protein [Clathrospora elynae]
MDQNKAPNSTGLENQLRDMMLGNVTMGSGQASQEPQSTHHERTRGQHRGPFSGRRGDGHHPNRTDQGRGRGSNAAANTAPPRGGGRGQPSSQRYQQPQPGPNMQNAVPANHQQNTPSQSRQPHHQRQAPNAGGAPRAQPRGILQRPQGNAIPSAQAQPYRPHPQGPYTYAPPPPMHTPRENSLAQVEHLDIMAAEKIPKIEMSVSESEAKQAFRKQLEDIMREAFAKEYPGDTATISLVGFGSLASGFGMPGSDMDLAVVPTWKDPARADELGINRHIPRLLERAVLDANMGGRLLTRTRVPILKVCQTPTEALYNALSDERQKWDELPDEEKYPTDHPPEPSPLPKPLVEVDGAKAAELTQHADSPSFGDDFPKLGTATTSKGKQKADAKPKSAKANSSLSSTRPNDTSSNATDNSTKKEQHPRPDKQWMREKIIGPLDFPKTGCGIQCDINFENPLGIHNTHMLRCYSLTDSRVRPIVLFVKSWAKRRKVNSAYSGTLSSYGWVLMVLHYLVNVAQPPVCPNLQLALPLPTEAAAIEQFSKATVAGYAVRFWRNEAEIIQAVQEGRLTQNNQSIGALLRGFFQYYASINHHYGPKPPQFYWTNEVLSLRTPGGILSKQVKGWVSATTKITAEKKVTNRYLFAIEDPFELDHNVARTVTHRGIVAIRDEFRRAWRILMAVGQGRQPEGGIFDEVVENVPPPMPMAKPEEAQQGTMESLGGDQEKKGRDDGQQRVL